MEHISGWHQTRKSLDFELESKCSSITHVVHLETMPSYLGTPLYGGAIVCDIPEKFADVRYVQSQISIVKPCLNFASRKSNRR